MSPNMIHLLIKALGETLYMVALSAAIASLFGIPLGVILTITGKGHIKENAALHKTLGSIVNALRSVPFIILMVAIIPLTRIIVGSSIGTTAAIVPLTISCTPFISRIIESSLLEVDPGVIEAAQSMGASTWQIITKVLLPEAMPSLINGSAVAAITILGYSAMSGAVGGGGLGKLAIMYGYNRYQTDIMIATVILLIIIVQIFQSFGNWATRRSDKRGS